MVNFKNRTIWTGDNLPVLRGINSNSIDLIYLDPPFNSNKSYSAPIGSKAAGAAFKDSWSLSDLDVSWMGLIADEHPAIYKFLESVPVLHGKSMQAYLCMMAIRLIEMRRILKDGGGVYLHCDDTASHYLKLLCDAVFLPSNFRNEIVWNYTGRGAKAIASRFGRNHDVILNYAKNHRRVVFNRQYIERRLSEQDARRRGYRVDEEGRWFKTAPRGDYTDASIERLDSEGRIYRTRTGSIRIKYFLTVQNRKIIEDVLVGNSWSDIPAGMHMGKERTGYPTQKPRKLLERIIEASSNKGDIVLDPFAGCATTCAAAEYLGRRWIGIDLSPLAYTLIQERLANELQLGSKESPRLTGWQVHHRTYPDLPIRSDIDKLPPYTTHKHTLFGQQEGRCGGCEMDFPFKLYEVDHIVPKSKGGTDSPENLQLLCGHCNKVKGNRSQAYLVSQLAKLGYV